MIFCTFKWSKSLLSGSEWYCQQAFRALIQAAGHCIRHRFDYGAIIFVGKDSLYTYLYPANCQLICYCSSKMLESLSWSILKADERFRQEKNLTYISKWIRKSIRKHDNFDLSLEGLKSFFRDVKVENNGSSMKPIDVTPIDFEEPRNWFTDMKNGKSTKPNLKEQRSGSDDVTKPGMNRLLQCNPAKHLQRDTMYKTSLN
ncbi:putative RNA helicase [Helianthus anomalus]